MYYINHIDFFSNHANVCVQESFKWTCPDFDPVTPLRIVEILTRKAKKRRRFFGDKGKKNKGVDSK